MANRLVVNLLPGWSDYSHENVDGPPTYVRDASKSPGALQVSCAWHTAGEEPKPTDADLVSLAANVVKSFASPTLLGTNTGPCAVGRFGTAVFRCEEFPRVQAWYLSNGRDFIIVTHICANDPDQTEVREAQQIVEAVAIEKVPWGGQCPPSSR